MPVEIFGVEVEAIGAIAIALGFSGWLLGSSFSTYVFLASTILGAAAAVVLPGLGYANIQPAHLLLVFLVVTALLKPEQLQLAAKSMAFPNEGFWLASTAAWGAVSAVLLPRLLAGSTYVFAIARTEIGPGIVSMPLAPTTGNITQPLYFIGDVICFLFFYSYCHRPEGVQVVMRAVLACAAINLVFAGLDLVTFWTGTGEALSIIRNANYRMLDDAVVLGFKRIVGSFPEASTFAYFTLAWFAFCTKLWLSGVHVRLTSVLSLLSLAALAFSTSSTGYAGMAGCLTALFVITLANTARRRVPRPALAFVTIVPFILAALVLALRLDTPAWTVVSDMVDRTVIEKLSSASGVERSAWNAQALTNFKDTDGLGAGVGSVRASSFPVAVLGNIGVLGAVTYAGFLGKLLFRRRDRWTAPIPAACQSAARWACFSQIVAASVAGSFIDLGLPFFIFAGLACAGPAQSFRRPVRPGGKVPVSIANNSLVSQPG